MRDIIVNEHPDGALVLTWPTSDGGRDAAILRRDTDLNVRLYELLVAVTIGGKR
jgi:hypothetical protein